MLIEQKAEELQTPYGSMRTYFFAPAAAPRDEGAKYPGVVLFSEIFQLTGPISRMAAYYAGHGYIVAVPEIFHELEQPGTVLAYDQAGADRGNADKTAKELRSYDEDARSVIRSLQARPDCTGKIGALGVCIGGHLAFRAAMNPEVLGAACFYATDIHKQSLGKGMADDSMKRAKDIRGELMMVWGRQDPHVPPEGRRAVYDCLHEAGVNFSWHEVNGVHAFLRDEGARYDPELVAIGQMLVLGLFARVLS